MAQDTVSEPTEKKIDKLEREVEQIKQDQTTPPPTGRVKHEAKDLTTKPTKSPRKILTLILIVGVVMLLIGVLVFALTGGNLLWLFAILLLGVVLLSGRIK